ncbi:5-formyltetrahydrofolate cyclo-ligase [Arthrobacter sp. B0490]|uniref:5-formyltetrahydrofolate cyclo-ligase n=1 Tax=Arthrobacter sp. B0490 TaxID=2058891 RepID=UPI000CE45DAF|nr:5-formyltetrahydrofolate cyclo-ligase [Arthrobacter sp. B0490]
MTLEKRDRAKPRLRASLRAARSALEPADRRDQARAIARSVVRYATALPADAGTGGRPTIAAYLGRDPEPDTAELLQELHVLGFGVVVPVCEPAYRLSWVDWVPGVALRRSVRAPVDEPIGPRRPFGELAAVGLILVPALAVDRSGHRIGQGGGYYDRFLATHPPDAPGAVARLGVVYRSELLPAGVIPTGPFDQRLGGVFTADGMHRSEAVGGSV